MGAKLNCHGQTDVGRRRAVNEDQFLIADLNKSMRVRQTSLGAEYEKRLWGQTQGKLLAVADGIGGHEAGERASQLVMDSVVTYALNTLHWFFGAASCTEHDFGDQLREALRHFQRVLQRDAEVAPQRQGMGTTLTLGFAMWPWMYVVHVGDSRCYLFREGQLKQITRDHTLAQLFKERGDESAERELTEEESSRFNNTLWNVISADEGDLQPEVYRFPLQTGDAVLLCTDGVTKHLNDEQISDVMATSESAALACQRMVDQANSAGGLDNITVIVCRILDEGDTEESLSDQLEDTGDYIAPVDTAEWTRPQPSDLSTPAIDH